MTTYKLVPVKPTEEMMNKGWNHTDDSDNMGRLWTAMLAAAPPPNDALVERVARAIWDDEEDDDPWEKSPEHWRDEYRSKARAAIKAIED